MARRSAYALTPAPESRTGLRAPGGTQRRRVQKQHVRYLSMEANSPQFIGTGGIAAGAGEVDRASRWSEEPPRRNVGPTTKEYFGSQEHRTDLIPGRPPQVAGLWESGCSRQFRLECPPTSRRRRRFRKSGDRGRHLNPLTARTDAGQRAPPARPERQRPTLDPHPLQSGLRHDTRCWSTRPAESTPTACRLLENSPLDETPRAYRPRESL